MNRKLALAAAMVADLAIGDPPGFPHPVSIIALLATKLERALRSPVDSPRRERTAGILTWIIVLGTTGAITNFVKRGMRPLVLASTLSFRSLLDHVRAVLQALERADIPAARDALSRIVGRDTQYLDVPEICRAAIETLAESTCDGIVAPLFFATIGGPAAAMGYKAVNTLDSLFGHIEPPYRDFGWCSARADDIANFVPARITAGAIVMASHLLYGTGHAACTTFLRDRNRHRSPNAGQCEAAMAGGLQVRLGGHNAYDGEILVTPYLGSEFSSPDVRDLRRAVQITILATVLCYGAALVFARR